MPGFTGDRGELNEHLNARLDAILKAALEKEEINNLQKHELLLCRCRWQPPGGRSLSATARCALKTCRQPVWTCVWRLSTSPTIPSPKWGWNTLLQVEVDVSYVSRIRSKLAASNYKILWSSNLPIRVVAAFAESNNRECEITETDNLTGGAECGVLRSDVLPEIVVLLSGSVPGGPAGNLG